jgi:hypothetical protein
MTNVISDPTGNDEVGAQIIALVYGESTSPDERRIRERFPISCKMMLTPIDRHSGPLPDESLIIFGKDLSRSGICFSHDLPLPEKQMIICLTLPNIGLFQVEAKLSWTRQTPIGLYESGCRLIRKIV